LSVRDKPAALAMDSFGRFILAAKQQPFFSVNALSFLMDATSGALSAANSVLSGCPGGACVGPISMITEPQGDFAYVVDSVGGLTSLAVNPLTGALTSVATSTNAWVPAPGGIGLPFTFAASGTSPAWQPNCTYSCAFVGWLASGGHGGGGTPPSNPNPPTSHYLSVSQAGDFGFVTSSPAGIDYGPGTILDPISHNLSANHFPANSHVQLCASPPPLVSEAYDFAWTGACSGTGQCTNVTMNSDKSCLLTFKSVRFRGL
jgi:hypothetical protein